MNPNTIVPVLATIILLGFIVLDAIFDEQLWKLNTQFTVALQKNNSPVEKVMFTIFSQMLYVPIAIAVILFVIMDRKLNIILYLVMCVGNQCLNALMKNIYHQPRPYMVEATIDSFECNADYGKPSGHAQGSLVMIFMFPLFIFPELYNLRRDSPKVDPVFESHSRTGYTIESFKDNGQSIQVNKFIHQKQQQRESDLENMPPQSYWMIASKLLLLVLMSCAVLAIGLSRVFKGVHSIGQVFLGWAFALYLITIYISVFKQPIRQQCINIFHNLKLGNGKHRQVIPGALIGLFFLIVLSCFLLLINVSFLVNQDEVEGWLVAVNSCLKNPPGKLTATSPLVLYNANFSQSLLGTIITGLLVGGLATKGLYKEGYPYREFIRTKPANLALRLAILISMYAILIPFAFVKTDSVYIQAFCQVQPLIQIQ